MAINSESVALASIMETEEGGGDSSGRALPVGWAAYVDESGATFYYHEASGVSQWIRPDEPEEEQKAHVHKQPAGLGAEQTGAADMPAHDLYHDAAAAQHWEAPADVMENRRQRMSALKVS